MVTVTHISGYSDTFISKFQCEIIILGQFLHLKEVFREVILTGILLSPIEWLNLNRHTLIINKRPYLNRHTLIIHRKACLFGTWVVTCGYCDTPLTVTLLPFPEGVTVSGHYCICPPLLLRRRWDSAYAGTCSQRARYPLKTSFWEKKQQGNSAVHGTASGKFWKWAEVS